jgi:GNAT superfamily N-acetyltransferase
MVSIHHSTFSDALMSFDIRNLGIGHAIAASRLTKASFERFVAIDWERGAVDEFLASTTIESFEDILRTSAYSIGMFDDEALTGLLVMQKPTILRMLFIHPDRTRQGIGRGLWAHARAHLESNVPQARTVELNSSPFAIRFYKSLGFVPISAEFVVNGARATRMACWLPAASLGAELGLDVA